MYVAVASKVINHTKMTVLALFIIQRGGSTRFKSLMTFATFEDGDQIDCMLEQTGGL